MKRAATGMIGGMLLAVMACATPTLAQTSQRDRCFEGVWARPPLTSDQMIEACTAVINSTNARQADRAAAFRRRGDAHWDKRDADRAIADLDRAVELDPTKPDGFFSRGLIYLARRDYDRAIADFTQTIRLEPESGLFLGTRGLAYARKGAYVRAIADYDRALAQYAKHADALFGRGIARLKGGDRTGGDADIAAALALAPGIAERYARYGVRP